MASILRSSVPVQAELPGSFPDAHPLHHHRPVNPQIYDFTWYIRRTIRSVEYNAPIDGGRTVYSFQPPNVSRLIRLRGPLYLRRLHQEG